MKFKLDENLPIELCVDLHGLGHEADTVHSEGLAGAVDSVILDRVRSEGRVLLTMDKGIGDVRVYPPESYAGIVLFRCPSSGRGAVLAFAREHLRAVTQLDLKRHLVVVTERSIRIR